MTAAERKTYSFYLAPEFTMLAFSSAIEALRLANTVLGEEFYQWQLVSLDGQPVRASCGVEVRSHRSTAEERKSVSTRFRPSNVVVCSGRNVERYRDRAIETWLRECKLANVEIAGICTGSYLLASAGLLDGKRCTIHWENLPGFVEQFPKAIVHAGVYESDGGIHSCAGGVACFDMMLHLIGKDLGEHIAAAVSQQAIIDRFRGPSENQRLPLSQRLGLVDSTINECVRHMVDHIDEPISILEMAEKINLSRRQIERLFKQSLNVSPAKYYQRLRLERARLLLFQSRLPVVDVAVACGFISGSHFSKSYRHEYGESPHETRTKSQPYGPTFSQRAR